MLGVWWVNFTFVQGVNAWSTQCLVHWLAVSLIELTSWRKGFQGT